MEMPATSDIVRLFRNAAQMNAFTSGQLFSFVLTDTSIMLPALVQCVRNNSVSTAAISPPATPAAAPPTEAPQPSKAPTAMPAADLHDEAMELATNFVLGAKLDSPKVLG